MKTLFSTILTAALLFTPCFSRAQSPEELMGVPPDEFENPAQIYLNSVMERSDQMLQAKDENGALALLTENFDHFARLRASLSAKMLDIFLAGDNAAEAKRFFLQHAPQDPEIARAGIDKIYSYYLRKQDNDAIIEWTAQLLKLPLPEDLQPLVFNWRLNAVCSGGTLEKARDIIKTCGAAFSPETCRTIFAPALSSLVEKNKYDDADRLLNMIEKEGKGAGELRSMAAAEKTKIFILREQWKEGKEFLMKKLADLSDGDLAGTISFAAAKARKDAEFDAVDQMCMFTLKNRQINSGAGNAAARASLAMLKANNKIPLIPARLGEFMDMGLKTPALYSVYCDYFYPVVMQENRDLAKQMMAFGDKFGGQLEKTDDQKQMALFGIDALFIIGDYEGALQAAAENKKYWPKDWLDSTRAKIGAHLALEKKNYSEAVEGFRKYMVYIAENKVGSYNPINEQIYTPDMLLGFNAMRIGNILRDNLKDEPGARKAYDEAEKYFKKAAKDVRPDTKEAKYIEEQMALLDARKKQ